jgi:putative membrane protein
MSRRLFGLAVTICAVAALATASIASAHGRHHSRHHVSAWDKEWLMSSIEGDRFEIAGGKIAEQKATNAQVKALGARLVADHSKSLASAVALARRLHIDVPDSPSPSEQWELKTVSRFSGAAFDKSYADLEVQDHIQDIQETSDEVDMGSNRAVRNEAKTDLPVLKQHLALARAALAAVGGNG